MVAMAPLLPTNTPPPMIPADGNHHEVTGEQATSRGGTVADPEAAASVAFKVSRSLLSCRKIRRNAPGVESGAPR